MVSKGCPSDWVIQLPKNKIVALQTQAAELLDSFERMRRVRASRVAAFLGLANFAIRTRPWLSYMVARLTKDLWWKSSALQQRQNSVHYFRPSDEAVSEIAAFLDIDEFVFRRPLLPLPSAFRRHVLLMTDSSLIAAGATLDFRNPWVHLWPASDRGCHINE